MNSFVLVSDKRGFGLPQVIALFILLIVGSVFIIAANLNLRQDSPIAKVTVMDMGDREGHILLMSLLRTPLMSVNDLPIIKSPVVADFIVMKNFGRIRTESTRNAARLQTIVGKIFGPLNNVSDDVGFGYAFYVDDILIGGQDILIKNKCSSIVRKDKPLLHEASTLIPGTKKNKEVRLKYCWIPKEDWV